MTIDLESQRVVAEQNAEAERRSFDGDRGETSRTRCPTIEIDGDDHDAGKSGDYDDAGKSSEAEPKKRKKYAPCWEHFTVITKKIKGKTIERAQCNHCRNDYAYDAHKNGTKSYNRHMEICKSRPRNGDVGKMMIDAEGKLQARKIDHMIFREMIAKCIIQHDLPFAYVEYERVRSVWKYLNADVKFISRHTAATDVYKLYESETQSLKRELADLPGRISFTSDLWTAITKEGYMCLTAHYVDRNWKLNNKIISFCAFPSPHTGIRMGMEILDKWKEWGIEKKVFSITLDNATNNDTMQEFLKNQLLLEDDLIAKGKYFHVRCAAHILNIIVQIGLRDIGDTLHKIRESIKYVQASGKREKTFADCVKMVRLQYKAGLILDVQTRWNSTYHMLDRAIKYQLAFAHLKLIDSRNYNFHLTEAEWHRLEMICDFLEPFNEITKLISGSTYPTSNLYFFQVWKINMWLLSNTNHADEIIKCMIIPMRERFDKYWEEVNDLFAMASVFYLRLKLTLAEYCYGQIDNSSSQTKVDDLCLKLSALFKSYENKTIFTSPATETGEIQQRDSGKASGSFSNYDGFMAFRKETVDTSIGKSSLELYLEDPPLDVDTFKSLDILQYWKDNSQRYGELASMACDILSIPITTVASESSFSIRSRVLSKYRSRLLPKNIQALICCRNWLKGFESYENEENEVYDEDETLPTFQSIVDDEDHMEEEDEDDEMDDYEDTL